jgi:hypothetical protein
MDAGSQAGDELISLVKAAEDREEHAVPPLPFGDRIFIFPGIIDRTAESRLSIGRSGR